MPDTPNPARGAKPSADRASLTLTPYLTPVYSFCFRLLNDATAAEDAAQETFLDAVKIWDRFVPPPTSTLLPSGNPVGGCAKDPRLQWLLAIAARRALNIRRQAVRFNPATEPAMEPTHEETPSAAAEQAETLSRLDAALCELPADQRQAVVLHHVAGMTQAEIAQSMALPPRTVSHRISDGLAALRARLERVAPAVSAGGTANLANANRAAEPSAGALGLLLVALPPVTAPASLAARVLTHPQILAWSSGSSVATASTATAGSAGTAPVPV
ncbi:MAG TPA: sigma-70 family RNA polymerase sigma factor, partial [Planctomycetota bacterium]|nr:sigma-70 family RNA polymerase sigma factor [Planctomycetota bacterium]